MIFPKKEILYAPMLGTLGGGSMRSFGRGTGAKIVLYRFLLIGGGGGAATNSSFHGTGGAGGVSMFDIEIPSGTSVTVTAGGKAAATSNFGGGGGHSRLQIPSLNFDAVVGGGGGSGYRDLGGLGGGVGIKGTAGIDYPGAAATSSGNLHASNTGSGWGGTITSGGNGGNGNTYNGQSGSAFAGGVFQFQNVASYPGGGGGSGYFGGGSGGDNNGQGGGPGGGGSGYLTVGTATGYNSLINANHVGRNSALFSANPTYTYNQGTSLNVVHGTIDYRYPNDYTTSGTTNSINNSRHLSHFHTLISSTDNRFTASLYGGGARVSRGTSSREGAVQAFAEDGTVLVNQLGNNNTTASSNNGNAVVTFTTP
jgi:hypothetical protein